MLREGDLIGIANEEVWFVNSTAIDEDTGEEIVLCAASWTPIHEQIYKKGNNLEECLEHKEDTWNYNEGLYSEWKDAVFQEETEDSYEDWARWRFSSLKEEAEKAGNQVWFYGQYAEPDDTGYELLTDEKLRKRVTDSFLEFTSLFEDRMASWDTARVSVPCDMYLREKIRPLSWQVVFNKEAVAGCNKAVEALNAKHTIWRDEHTKIVKGVTTRFECELPKPKLKGGKND